jgi:hypothetical protein
MKFFSQLILIAHSHLSFEELSLSRFGAVQGRGQASFGGARFFYQ